MGLKITQFGGTKAGSDAAAPTNGTSGTGAGIMGIGALYTDTLNGVLYINTGTQVSPTWTKVGTQS
jgi:hypothetical protein